MSKPTLPKGEYIKGHKNDNTDMESWMKVQMEGFRGEGGMRGTSATTTIKMWLKQQIVHICFSKAIQGCAILWVCWYMHLVYRMTPEMSSAELNATYNGFFRKLS